MTEAFANKVTYYLGGTEFRSNRDLAEAAGISPRTIGRILAGTANAKPDVASRLKTALNVSQEDEAEFFLLAAGHSGPDVEHATGREATAFHAMDLTNKASIETLSERRRRDGYPSNEDNQREILVEVEHATEVALSVMAGRGIVFDPNLPVQISP